MISCQSALAGREKPTDPFNIIPDQKSLRHFSQFEPIDDFSTGVKQNRQLGEWRAQKSKGSKVSIEADPKDSLSTVGGGSLKISYQIAPKGRVMVWSALNSLDMSKAEFVIAHVRTAEWKNFGGEKFFGFKDARKRTAWVEIKKSHLIERSGKSGAWSAIKIPVKSFRKVDLNKLERFEIVLEGAKKSMKGLVLLDNIAFQGVDDLVFESAADNLKGFPSGAANLRGERLGQVDDTNEFLLEIARDTWRYFDQAVDRETGLIVDHIRVGQVRGVGSYTSPTNLAFYWLSCVAAVDLGFVDREEALEKIDRSFKTLKKLEMWQNKYFYNFYHTRSLLPSKRYVSSVDNGWLVAALLVLKQAFPGEFDRDIDRMVRGINFSEFIDPANGQMRLGFDEDEASLSAYHYGLLISEARLMSYVAVAKGDVPKKHWAQIYRTLPGEWKWQNQVPKGRQQVLFGIPVFEGYYTYESWNIVPSWGGSLFEILTPALLLDEQGMAPKGLGLNNIRSIEAHIDYALKKQGYPLWGIAPAAIENGKAWLYKELGVKQIAAKGYPDEAIIAPYASMLALEAKPKETVANLRKMLELFPNVYGPYGFFDAVELERKRVNPQYLALDQGMSMIALANYLGEGAIKKRFHRDPMVKAGEVLLQEERFFD